MGTHEKHESRGSDANEERETGDEDQPGHATLEEVPPPERRFRQLAITPFIDSANSRVEPCVPRWETVEERGDSPRQDDLGLLFVLGLVQVLFSAAATAFFLVREGRVVRVASQGLLQLKIRRSF